MITKKQLYVEPGSFAVEVPWKIPSKKNSYEILFAPKLWSAIRPIIDRFKRERRVKRLYWISPKSRVKQFEKDLSTWFALYLPNFGDSPLNIVVRVNQKNDVDNIAGAVLDALEKSRCIVNDRQVESITIKRATDIDIPIVHITPICGTLDAAA